MIDAVNSFSMRYSIIFLMIFFAACSNKTEQSLVQEEISTIYVNLDEAAPLHMSEFISEIEYLPLETPNDEPIGRIRKIILSDDFIGLHDASRNSVWLFTHEGDFINRIRIPHGKGPGELEHLSDVIITSDQEIHALGAYRINIYNIEGEFIEQVEKNYLVYRFIYDPESGNYIGYTNNTTNITLPEGHSEKNLLIFDKKGSIQNGFIPVPKGRVNMGFGVPNNFPEIRDQVRFFSHLNDTVYTLDGESVYPKYILDYGKNSIPAEVFDRRSNYSQLSYEWLEFSENELRDKNYVRYLTFFNETDSHIFFRIGTGANSFNVLYNRDLNETKVGTNRLINDLDFNYVSFIYESSDKALYTYIESYDLIHHLKKMKEDEPEKYEDPALDKLKEVASQLSEDSNPVLQILKLKNPN